MALKNALNHSPDWYFEHCTDENVKGAVRTMLKHDMAYIGADDQKGMVGTEKIGVYKERWDAILKGADNHHESDGRLFRSDVLLEAMHTVMERESLAGFKPSDQFKHEPFLSIDKIMVEAGLNEKTVREFLGWRSRWGPLTKKEEVPIQEPASKIEMRKKLKEQMNRLARRHTSSE